MAENRLADTLALTGSEVSAINRLYCIAYNKSLSTVQPLQK